jgi:hypothetical protein
VSQVFDLERTFDFGIFPFPQYVNHPLPYLPNFTPAAMILIYVNGKSCLSRTGGLPQLTIVPCSADLANTNPQFHWKLISHYDVHSQVHSYNIVDPLSPTTCIDVSGSEQPVLEMYPCGDRQPNQLFTFQQNTMRSSFPKENSCMAIHTNTDLAEASFLLSTSCSDEVAAINIMAINNDPEQKGRALPSTTQPMPLPMPMVDETLLVKSKQASIDRLKQLDDVMENKHSRLVDDGISAPENAFASPPFLFLYGMVLLYFFRQMFVLKREASSASKKDVRKRRYQ